MKLNFKNLPDIVTGKRLIPKDGASASANIGVNNPTLDISDDGIIQFCLAPAKQNSTDVPEILQPLNGMNGSG